MKKILPINHFDAFPNVYPHEAVLNGIMDSYIAVDGIIAEIEINDNLLDIWNVVSNKSIVNIDDNKIKIYANKYAKGVNGTVYKKYNLDEDFELSIHVTKQAKWHPWSYIGLCFCYDSNFINYINEWNGVDKILVCNKKGLLVIDENKEIYKDIFLNNDYWLKISVVNKHMQHYYSRDGEKWYKIFNKFCDDIDTIYCGIIYNFAEAIYYNWYFHHYLLISFSHDLLNSTDGVPIEFYNEINKNYDDYLFHPFFKFYTISQDYLNCETKSNQKKPCFLDIIKKAIDLGNCVEIKLNEFYISNRKAFNRNIFFHTNFIYGYDDVTEEMYVLGNTPTGKLGTCVVKYDALIKANTEGKHDLHIIQCDYPFSPSSIEKKNIVADLIQYIDSININEKYNFLSPIRRRGFGFSIYDAILNNDTNFEALLKDIRISHLLYEHKKVLCVLARFMKEREMIDDANYLTISSDFTELETLALVIRNLICKYKVLKTQCDEAFIVKLKGLVVELKDKEYESIQKALFLIK